MRPSSHSPIGVFDSGIGGLTVLKALLARLPAESTVYLGDTARVPYGSKSPEVVTRYSLANAHFLIDQGVKLLVIACNTATAVALPALSSSLDIPVLGVIEPGSASAVKATRSGRIGVIGTEGTIRSQAYTRAVMALRPDAQVTSRVCSLFVPLAEEGWTTGEVPTLVARKYLSELTAIDTLVLGCTHYPLLRNVVAQALPHVTLVDSAEATAEAVAEKLQTLGMQASPGDETTHRYFVTDVPERFTQVGARFLGREIANATQVDISSFASTQRP
ncbi:MAG: glutamate racemase [Myxococcaceae bacterium]